MSARLGLMTVTDCHSEFPYSLQMDFAGISLPVICHFLSFQSILSKSNISWLKTALLSGQLMDLLGICWIAGTRVQLGTLFSFCESMPGAMLFLQGSCSHARSGE